MEIKHTAAGNAIEPPKRWTFWRNSKEKRTFLLVDYYLHPTGEGHVWLKEIIKGKCATTTKVALAVFYELVKEKKLEEFLIEV
jgi:hypothetical protein